MGYSFLGVVAENGVGEAGGGGGPSVVLHFPALLKFKSTSSWIVGLRKLSLKPKSNSGRGNGRIGILPPSLKPVSISNERLTGFPGLVTACELQPCVVNDDNTNRLTIMSFFIIVWGPIGPPTFNYLGGKQSGVVQDCSEQAGRL